MVDYDFESFVATLKENPSDDGLRLILADWLEENGDSKKAEYLRVNVERRKLHIKCKKCDGSGKSWRYRKTPAIAQRWGGPIRVRLNCTKCKGKGYNPEGQEVLKRESELLCEGWYEGFPPHPEDDKTIAMIDFFIKNPNIVETIYRCSSKMEI